MDLVLGSRFAAVFFVGGILPNPLDIRFQRVSGLSATIETTTVGEGGQNLYTHRLPRRVGYNNLVLERGFVIGSPLNIEFNIAMSLF
ncbi:MAG: phage tail protein, partial [Myxococcales bacterium]|nr:phage tail protein [Myxococcales bacterium]